MCRLHKMLWLSLLVLTFLVVIPAPRASACSCSPPATASLALQQADAVFTATVTRQYYLSSSWNVSWDFPFLHQHPNYPLAFEMNVTHVWKGNITQTTTFTIGPILSCEYPLMVGHAYLIYAHYTSQGMMTSICDRTNEAQTPQAQDDVRTLGSGTTPLPTAQISQSTTSAVSVTIAVVLALVLTGVLASWFRHRTKRSNS